MIQNIQLTTGRVICIILIFLAVSTVILLLLMRFINDGFTRVKV